MEIEERKEIIERFDKKFISKDSTGREDWSGYSSPEIFKVRNMFIEIAMEFERRGYEMGMKQGFVDGYKECRLTYRDLFKEISLKDNKNVSKLK